MATLDIRSDYQPGTQQVQFAFPASRQGLRRIVYVLPVEPLGGTAFGDPLREIEVLALPDRYGAVFATPSFGQSPWYADHPAHREIRQESHFLHAVCPALERSLGWEGGPVQRFLLGFSKSGLGAWSLLLRHPQYFHRALAWDAPLMQEKFQFWEAPEVYGSQSNFDTYRPALLLPALKDALGAAPRLLMSGHCLYGRHHAAMHLLLDKLGVAHHYVRRRYWRHRWRRSWLEPAVRLLLS